MCRACIKGLEFICKLQSAQPAKHEGRPLLNRAAFSLLSGLFLLSSLFLPLLQLRHAAARAYICIRRSSSSSILRAIAPFSARLKLPLQLPACPPARLPVLLLPCGLHLLLHALSLSFFEGRRRLPSSSPVATAAVALFFVVGVVVGSIRKEGGIVFVTSRIDFAHVGVSPIPKRKERSETMQQFVERLPREEEEEKDATTD
jgi:hypothetical protein